MERHRRLMSAYTEQAALLQTDMEVLRKHYQFLLDEDLDDSQWQVRMVRAYHDRLFKEYCLADFSRLPKVGLRWRSEREVVSGRGQFTCGNVDCSGSAGLATSEVNFGYVEQGVKKNALVKLRLCSDCYSLLPGGKSGPDSDLDLLP